MIRISREEAGGKGRFVITENEEFGGEMTFTRAGTSKFIIDHTAIEEKFRGRSFGRKLLSEVVEYARKNDQKIIPLCPYAKSVFDKDENIRDVLA